MDETAAWAAAMAALLGPAGVIVARWWDRASSREAKQGDWREQREQRQFKQQETLMASAWRRVSDLEADLQRAEADRDRFQLLARGWFERAHYERHRHIDTLQVAVGGLAHDGDFRARAPDNLPAFHNIVPRDDP